MSEINFNKEQKEAIIHNNGALGVVASAGAGKTSVLLARIHHMITEENISQKDLLAISFTNLTAKELKVKLSKMGHRHVNVGTFHAICAQILYQEGVKLNGLNLIKDWQVDNIFTAINKKADVKSIQSFISYQKNHGIDVNDKFVEKEMPYSEKEMREYFKAYEDFKQKKRVYDFDDYLLLCLDVLRKNPGKYTYDYILVDEHQDSNSVQNALLKEWCQSGNITTIFDGKQSIYGFRGSDLRYSMNFHNDWDADIINLFTNYRSANNIVEQSNHFIRKYFGDYEHYVDSKANRDDDGIIKVHHYSNAGAEAIGVVNKIEQLIEDGEPLNEIAVLYRLNKHSHFIEAELKRRDIDYEISNDSSFFKRREIAGINAYLRLAQNKQDDNAFETIFKLRNQPLKYFSNHLFTRVQDLADEEDISLFEAFSEVRLDKPWMKKNITSFVQSVNKLNLQAKKEVAVDKLIDNVVKTFKVKDFIYDTYSNQDEIEERLASISVLKTFVQNNNLEQFINYVYSSSDKRKKKKNAVRLMSIHRSKGLEFDNVFVVGVEDGQFPHDRAGTDFDEEVRLFYVATTRPRNNLFISEIGMGNRFIQEYGIESEKDASIYITK